MARVDIVDPRFDKPISYYMEDKIKKRIEEKITNALKTKDKDYVIAIDGQEGSGKSTFAFQIGKLVDPTLNLNRVVFTAEEFKQAVFKAKKGECIIYDEAFTGLSSRSSLSGINRYLISLMMQMRQKNLFIIVVLPTFFLLDKYVALWRTKILIHVYECGGRRGYFKVYNQKLKKRLFLEGRPTYSYMIKKIRPKLRGRFYGVFALGDEKEEEKYRNKKMKALEDTEKNPMSAGQIKYMEQRDILLYILRKTSGLKYQALANLLNDYDMNLSYVQVRNICAKFGDYEDKSNKKEEKQLNNEENDKIVEELDGETMESDGSGVG